MANNYNYDYDYDDYDYDYDKNKKRITENNIQATANYQQGIQQQLAATENCNCAADDDQKNIETKDT